MDLISQIKELRKLGHSRDKIESILGCSSFTVSKALCDKTNDIGNEVIALRKEGLSVKAIAKELGISVSTSSKWCSLVEGNEELKKRRNIHNKIDGFYHKNCTVCGKPFTSATSRRKNCDEHGSGHLFKSAKDDPKWLEICKKGAYSSLLSRKPTTSKIETDFGSLIPEGFVSNDRKLLGGLEIDYLYNKLAVEYHGTWHYSNFHDHYRSVVERDRRKNTSLLKMGYNHYVVGWSTHNRQPVEFLQQHAYFVNQAYLKSENQDFISPFLFNYDRNLFDLEYSRLVRSKGKSGYICNNIVNWYHSYRWFQSTQTKQISAVDFWEHNRDVVLNNREKYSDFRPINLRRYFLLFDFTPSLFSEVCAKNLAHEIMGNDVIDPFSGYGNRMLGVCAAGKRYLGHDINKLTCNANTAMAHDLSINAKIKLGDSAKLNPEIADGLITCPPYSDKDLYGVKSNLDYYEMLFETFRRFKFRELGFVIIKPTLVNIEKFKKSIGNVIEQREINWGGMGRKSIHLILILKSNI
jgi:hypothetical protein